MVLAAEFAPVSRVWASMLTPKGRRYASGVDAGSIQQDLVMFAEATQDRIMNTLLNAGLHPLVKATPTGHAAAAAELTRQILPRYSGPEDEQNSSQGARSLMRGRPPFGDRQCFGR